MGLYPPTKPTWKLLEAPEKGPLGATSMFRSQIPNMAVVSQMMWIDSWVYVLQLLLKACCRGSMNSAVSQSGLLDPLWDDALFFAVTTWAVYQYPRAD